MQNRLLIGLAALVAAGFVAFFGGAFSSSPSTPASALAGSQSVQDFKAGFALTANTASLVLQLQSTLQASRTRPARTTSRLLRPRYPGSLMTAGMVSLRAMSGGTFQ